MNENKRLYFHYCSIEKFQNILDSKVLWLCDLTDSNDTEEVTRTFENIWETVKSKLLVSDLDGDIVKQEIDILDRQYQIEIMNTTPFGVCFCKYPDVLQQWLEYGDRTRGVVLGFDINWFNNLNNLRPHPSTIFEKSIGYDDVLYHNDEIENSLYDICYNSIKKYGLRAWLLGGILPTFKHYAAFIKNPTFFGEKETRIVYYPQEDESFEDNILQVSSLEKKPFNHYSLPWANSFNGTTALRVIGMGCNCSLDKNEIQKILTNAGLCGEFGIFRSTCSYRLR